MTSDAELYYVIMSSLSADRPRNDIDVSEDLNLSRSKIISYFTFLIFFLYINIYLSFYLVLKWLMITRSLVVKIQNLVVIHESWLAKLNPDSIWDVFFSRISVKHIWQRYMFFSKYLSVTHFFSLSQLRESSQQPPLVPFCFQDQLWDGFTSTKSFFECCLIRSTHPELFFNEKWNIHRLSFKKAVLNIFRKFLEKHQGQSFYSA